jgi:hypothetical protein
MNAIDLLEQQHDDLAALFARVADDRHSVALRQRHLEELGELLEFHAILAERHLYPALQAERTEAVLRASRERQRAMARALTALRALPVGSAPFDAQLAALHKEVRGHVRAERRELFPRAQRLLDADLLEAIGQEMTATLTDLQMRAEGAAAPSQQPEGPPPLAMRPLLREIAGNLVGFLVAPLRTAVELIRSARRREREA